MMMKMMMKMNKKIKIKIKKKSTPLVARLSPEPIARPLGAPFMAAKASLWLMVLLFTFSCRQSPTARDKSTDSTGASIDTTGQLTDSALFDLVQQRTFQYFYTGAEANSKMAPERIHMDGNYPDRDQTVITTGGSGFGIMALIVGIERHFISRQQGVQRLTDIVRFLEKADRYHGAYSHWYEGTTGKTKPFGTKDNGGDLVETSLLMQGLLTARQYLLTGDQAEKSLAARIDKL